MTDQLPAIASPTKITACLRAAYPVPALIAASGERASLRFLEFFAANIRNPHTRRAYGRAVADFLAWCDDQGVPSVSAVQPLNVAAWIELQQQDLPGRQPVEQVAQCGQPRFDGRRCALCRSARPNRSAVPRIR